MFGFVGVVCRVGAVQLILGGQCTAPLFFTAIRKKMMPQKKSINQLNSWAQIFAELEDYPEVQLWLTVKLNPSDRLCFGKFTGISTEYEGNNLKDYPIILDYLADGRSWFHYGAFDPKNQYFSDIGQLQLYPGMTFCWRDSDATYKYVINFVR